MPADDESWFRYELLTSTPDIVAALAWQVGAAGVELQDEYTLSAEVPSGLTRVVAFFQDTDPGSTLRELPGVEAVSGGTFDDDSDWATAWQAHFKPELVSPRVRVGPPWETFGPPQDGIAVRIEPGMAFGTGTHETTALCTQMLDATVANHPPLAMLDVGCGTGVLSFVAHGLGVPRVVGMDVDPVAVEVARANAALNDVGDEAVQLTDRPIAELGEFPLVVANIISGILLQLRDELVRATAAGGVLITSGITVEQVDDFIDQFGQQPLELDERRDHGEWSALRWRRH